MNEVHTIIVNPLKAVGQNPFADYTYMYYIFDTTTQKCSEIVYPIGIIKRRTKNPLISHFDAVTGSTDTCLETSNISQTTVEKLLPLDNTSISYVYTKIVV